MTTPSLLLSGRRACCAPRARVLRRPCICPGGAHVVRPVSRCCARYADRASWLALLAAPALLAVRPNLLRVLRRPYVLMCAFSIDFLSNPLIIFS